jgi:hypothetical protein
VVHTTPMECSSSTNMADVSTMKQVILTNNPPPRVEEFSSKSSIWKESITYLRNSQLSDGTEVKIGMFSDKVLLAITNQFGMLDDATRAQAPDFLKPFRDLPSNWVATFTARQIASLLEYLFPDESNEKVKHKSVNDMLKSKSFNIRSFKKDSMEQYSNHLMEVETQFNGSNLSVTDMKSAVETAIEVLKSGQHSTNFHNWMHAKLSSWYNACISEGNHVTLTDLRLQYRDLCVTIKNHQHLVDQVNSSSQYFMEYAAEFRDSRTKLSSSKEANVPQMKAKNKQVFNTPKVETNKPKVNTQRFHCNGCGRLLVDAKSHAKACTACVGHPDRNQHGRWKESEVYKFLLKAKPGGSSNRVLPLKKRAIGDELTKLQLEEVNKSLLRTDIPKAFIQLYS